MDNKIAVLSGDGIATLDVPLVPTLLSTQEMGSGVAELIRSGN